MSSRIRFAYSDGFVCVKRASINQTSLHLFIISETYLAVKRNYKLELCLHPSASLLATDSDNDTMRDRSTGSPQQQLTIFFKGQVCVRDVTELQARAIIWLASREIEERMNTSRSESVSPSLKSQLYSLSGISMKRSLQGFLQNRKKRIRATSP
ncbi:hypothetical protein HHK36_001553 [Tetracentron sinense]|uniref:Protein TIFY n=1 Tax=Tetracentron sinense TaxID=13715 RepID=A0A834ZW94_TETSI|nr:hypothetical protein HHK36_001553 [Tetracentron sinense]